MSCTNAESNGKGYDSSILYIVDLVKILKGSFLVSILGIYSLLPKTSVEVSAVDIGISCRRVFYTPANFDYLFMLKR